jgi:hypothetical protein
MGIMEIATKNRIWESTATQSSVQNQAMYALPGDLIQLEAVQINTTMLTGINFETMVGLTRGEIQQAGLPIYWFTWQNQLSFYPVPDKDGYTITIYYRGQPPQVFSKSDPLPIPDKYFDTLTSFVLSKAYELDEDWDGQQNQRQQFESNLNGMKEETDTTSGTFFVITDPIYETWA